MWASGTPVAVFDMMDDSLGGGSPPSADHNHEARVVNGWGGSFTDGKIATWDDDAAVWTEVATLAAGTVVVVAPIEGAPGGSFSNFRGQIVRYDGVSWSRIDSNAAMRFVVTVNDPYYVQQTWAWNVQHGWARVADMRAPMRVFDQDGAPDPTQIGDGESAIWHDTDDNKFYFAFGDGSKVYGVELDLTLWSPA